MVELVTIGGVSIGISRIYEPDGEKVIYLSQGQPEWIIGDLEEAKKLRADLDEIINLFNSTNKS